MFDVIVVGARVGGSATARLLALQGLDVLVVDRARFPSDTVSSHQLQVPGGACLERWGLLNRVVVAGTPATRSIEFDPGNVSLVGRVLPYQGVDALYSPKRLFLDAMLVDAAREAGAEVREGCVVDEVMFESGRACGVRGRTSAGSPFSESARFVVGADGRRSRVATSVGAATLLERPPMTVSFYAYWSGLEERAQVFTRPGRSVGVWPTNDDQVVTFVSAPISEVAEFRGSAEAALLRTFDEMADLGERIRAATRVGRIAGNANVPNFFRKPHGPGWALVGDAGLTMDPITGQGISQALQDAELVARALVRGFRGSCTFEAALDIYEEERNRRARPIFDLTLELADFRPRPVEERVLYESMLRHPEQVDRLLAVLAGTLPMRTFRSPANLIRLLGLRGVGRILAAKLFDRRSAENPPSSPTCPSEAE